MQRKYFQQLESLSDSLALSLNEVIDNLAFNDQGLLPVITQDATTKEILMFAWMNREALELTLSTRQVTYWSRSRQELWLKGATSVTHKPGSLTVEGEKLL